MTFLRSFPVMRTRDPDLARDRLFAVYNANSFDAHPADREKFEVRANHLQLGDVGLSYCSYDGTASLGFGQDDIARQIFSFGSGSGRWSSGDRAGEIAPNSWTPVLTTQRSMRFVFGSGYRHLILRIKRNALRQSLEALLDQEVTEDLLFESSAGNEIAMMRLRQRILQIASDFDAQGQLFSDRVAREISSNLIFEFLIFNKHNRTHLLHREPQSIGSSSVRKVEEFIEANWDRSVDMVTVSAIAGVSARSLFRQFKKDRGCSPAEFLKRTRLERARELLQQSDRDTTVTQVALKCGFQNSGHFARDFRLCFGELPSETLRRSRTPKAEHDASRRA
jgi:AraC-like DNA-binding protein